MAAICRSDASVCCRRLPTSLPEARTAAGFTCKTCKISPNFSAFAASASGGVARLFVTVKLCVCNLRPPKNEYVMFAPALCLRFAGVAQNWLSSGGTVKSAVVPVSTPRSSQLLEVFAAGLSHAVPLALPGCGRSLHRSCGGVSVNAPSVSMICSRSQV